MSWRRVLFRAMKCPPPSHHQKVSTIHRGKREAVPHVLLCSRGMVGTRFSLHDLARGGLVGTSCLLQWWSALPHCRSWGIKARGETMGSEAAGGVLGLQCRAQQQEFRRPAPAVLGTPCWATVPGDALLVCTYENAVRSHLSWGRVTCLWGHPACGPNLCWEDTCGTRSRLGL